MTFFGIRLRATGAKLSLAVQGSVRGRAGVAGI